MRTIILLFCTILHINLDGMKRKCDKEDNRIAKNKKRSLKETTSDKYLYLPDDILFFILHTIPYNKKEVMSKRKKIRYEKDKLKITIDTIKTFAITCKSLYGYYNNKETFDYLLNTIHKTHDCSHESVMNYLCPPISLNQWIIQIDLKKLILTEESSSIFENKFDALLNNGARLDFTYNYHHQPHTPLMMMISSKRNVNLFLPETNIINLFLTRGSKINETASHGTTPLMSAAKYPICPTHVKHIIKQDNIDINQRNNRKETALIHCIRNRKKYDISSIFIETIKELLKYGADPCLQDKHGNTALSRAKKLKDDIIAKPQIIELLKDAIAKKTLPS